jgi:hypothetical protein
LKETASQENNTSLIESDNGSLYGVLSDISTSVNTSSSVSGINNISESKQEPDYYILSQIDEDRYFVLHKLNSKFGIVDKKGNYLIEPIYDYIDTDICDGMIRVYHNGYFGFLDLELNLAIPFQYEAAEFFSDGMCIVFIDGKCGYIDKENRLIVPAIYEKACKFEDGFAIVFSLFKSVYENNPNTDPRFGESAVTLSQFEVVDIEGNSIYKSNFILQESGLYTLGSGLSRIFYETGKIPILDTSSATEKNADINGKWTLFPAYPERAIISLLREKMFALQYSVEPIYEVIEWHEGMKYELVDPAELLAQE